MRLSRTRVAGHFGEWLQGLAAPGGPVALVTLPCPTLCLTATARPARGLLLHDPARILPPGRARAFLRALGLRAQARIRLLPQMPPGGGAGASTAALVALARLCAPDAGPDQVARACLAVEGASDPLMFRDPARLIWASRRGAVLGHLPEPPRAEILGGFYGPPMRTDPADRRFPVIDDLLQDWARGGDLAHHAQLAAESARRTLALRGPADDPTEALARTFGALGHVIAHTGAARGLVFAPGTVPPEAAARLRAAGFTGLHRFLT